jgi:hypothetical protein
MASWLMIEWSKSAAKKSKETAKRRVAAEIHAIRDIAGGAI